VTLFEIIVDVSFFTFVESNVLS